MNPKAEYPGSRIAVTGIMLAAILGSLYFSLFGPKGILPIGIGDALFGAVLAIQCVLAIRLMRSPGLDHAALAWAAEVLFFTVGAQYLFAYIFAANAEMDYVQRFIELGGNVRLAIDTRAERAVATARFLPLLLSAAALWWWARRQLFASEDRGVPFAPALVLLAVALSVVAVPSVFSLEGIGILGWFALVPLFLVLRLARRFSERLWYGLLFGVFHTLIGNYWLGTFNLISLQAVGIIFLGFYLILMIVVATALTVVRRGVVFVLPLAWTAFELMRSSGFLGYPWLLTAHSQYRFTTLIQIAELGGVWLVSLVVLLVNAFLTEAIIAVRLQPSWLALRKPLVSAVVTLALAVGVGALLERRPIPMARTVRVALIQQNSDPRKHNYEETLAALMRLTDAALDEEPDLVVWSETAFVPNIRRWAQEDPQREYFARLVQEFLAYQRSRGIWLLTGNDDYQRIFDAQGLEVERQSFNAAVLFDPMGERRETYHKIKLVPFTEHFPYQRQLPWLYDLLLTFDIHFWTPGTERVVFVHPKLRFSTPICFEDAFPAEVRAFAREGMEVIVNISNDYWSLTEVAAQQHFVAALFRAVELRRPMVRSTASGVTAHVDPWGRTVAAIGQYREAYLVTDVAVPRDPRRTAYLVFGDWVPLLSAGLLAVLLAASAPIARRIGGKRRVG